MLLAPSSQERVPRRRGSVPGPGGQRPPANSPSSPSIPRTERGGRGNLVSSHSPGPRHLRLQPQSGRPIDTGIDKLVTGIDTPSLLGCTQTAVAQNYEPDQQLLVCTVRYWGAMFCNEREVEEP